MRYQPKPLEIPHLVLIRAQRGEGGDDTPYQEIYADDAFGWRAVAENITLVDVDGGHSTLLRERFVDSLAAALLPYLGERARQPRIPHQKLTESLGNSSSIAKKSDFGSGESRIL
jgi:hypothetical protein